MTVRFHPEDTTLTAHAVGALSEPFAVLVAAHAEVCAECRARLSAFNAIGGALLVRAAAEPLSEGALQSVLARLDAAEPPRSSMPARPSGELGMPEALARLVGGGFSALRWRELTPTVADSRYRFQTRSGQQTLRFLRAEPGDEIPEHAHPGVELTLVIRGALEDLGRVNGPGDVVDVSEGSLHNPVAVGGETCVCVIAEAGPPQFVSAEMRAWSDAIGL